MSQYQPHQPGEAPPKPDRKNGVQQFAAKPKPVPVTPDQAPPVPDTCPPGMTRDASGSCVPEDGGQ
ncbi:hypothetical protein [Streptomyces mirabilis]|uniref:hypothetical protein n=1 Tax=Streptomyces mirabilis TaxID=68239 RepID=UPI00332A1055